mmetsp:Transcript_4965/g.16418  ORF Transcript_4965/g.16418 Transcript_4965/m.16418 type:complete len:453 (+) Transcript_4965:22-1380(+)
MTDFAKPVGVLFIVFGAGAPPHKLAAYTTQVIASARRARLTNPQLPVGLVYDSLTRRQLTPAALLGSVFTDLRTVQFSQTSSLGSPWLKRLQALALSPYDLTLELDASATVCSPLLHPLLLKEHAADAADLAVNFEASALLPSGSQKFGPPPGAVEDLLPHNFALLMRKGPRLDALLQMLRHDVLRVGDDQWALRATLRRLARSGYLVCRHWRHASQWTVGPPLASTAHKRRSEDGAWGGLAAALWRRPECIVVRVRRLTENILGLKAADKLASFKAGITRKITIWPIYSRPVDGQVLALHSYDPPGGNATSMCALLNARSPSRRLLLQPARRSRYLMPATQAECNSTFHNSRPPKLAYATRICSWLPARPSRTSTSGGADELVIAGWERRNGTYLDSDAGTHLGRFDSNGVEATRLTESLDDFWQWLVHQTPTTSSGRRAGTPHSHAAARR